MNTSFTIAIVSGCLFAAVAIGMWLRRRLPENHSSAESKDTVKLAMGLVATMAALLLGMLVSSAKSSYDTTRGQVIQMAAKVALLDRMLGVYGPDAGELRRELREVQAEGAVGMRVEEDKAKKMNAVMFFRGDDVSDDIAAKAAEIRRLLKLPPEGQKFTLTYSPVRGADGELAVNSRSMLQIMSAYSSYIEVPKAHQKDRSAIPALERVVPENRAQIVRIRSGKDKPAHSFAAVHYREHWFWIEDSDFQTKRALTAVIYFFTLAETGDPGKLPLITIPAQ